MSSPGSSKTSINTQLLHLHHHHPHHFIYLHFLLTMAEIKKNLTFSLALSFLIFCNVSLAQLPQQQQQQQQPEQPSRGWFIRQQLRDCNIQQLRALEPTRRVEAEAGFTEYWNSRDTQFNCAGVSIQRTVIQPGGLLQLSFDNAARVTFIEQGSLLDTSLLIYLSPMLQVIH